MSKRSSNPGFGRKFTFFGKFKSLILARRSERDHPKSFILYRGHHYYVMKPNSRSRNHKSSVIHKRNPVGTVVYGRVLKIFAQKTSGPYKGQRFVHTFKRGAIMIGKPDGSLVIKHS